MFYNLNGLNNLEKLLCNKNSISKLTEYIIENYYNLQIEVEEVTKR